MDRLGASEAREHFGNILNRVAFGKERVVVERRGKDLAAIVSMDDLMLLEALEDQADLRAALEAMAEVEKEGTVSLDEALKMFKIER